MPNDLTTTLPRRATNNLHPCSDADALPPHRQVLDLPPHLRVLEFKEVPARGPEPAKPKRQEWTFPPFAEEAAIQQRAEKETIAQNDTECPVCQEGFHHDEDVIRIEGCRHAFHTVECFQPWFETEAGTCPYCRGALDKLTPGVWKRGEGVVPGDFCFLASPTGVYVRAWNGNHPELWEASPMVYTWGGELRASVKHRSEDVCDLIVDWPMTIDEHGFLGASAAADFGDFDQDEDELESDDDDSGSVDVLLLLPQADDEPGERADLIRAVRAGLAGLDETLQTLTPELEAGARPIFELLASNLRGYLALLEVGRRF